MKTRNGFVSNSSASSFIVHHIHFMDRLIGKAVRLDKKDIKKLLKYGFKETHLSHPSHLDNSDLDDKSIWKPLIYKGKIVTRNFGYGVSCNESDVIHFLVKNNIGFIATGHYGHVTYLFHQNDKHVMVFRNFGMEVETYYYNESWKNIMKNWGIRGKHELPYYRIPVKKILKNWY